MADSGNRPVPICPNCTMPVEITAKVIGRDYAQLRCSLHYRHKECPTHCRLCQCFVCDQMIPEAVLPETSTCGCKAHPGCVGRGWLLPSTPIRCNRCLKSVDIIRAKRPPPPSFMAQMFGQAKISAYEITTAPKTAREYMQAGVTGEDIYKSDVTVAHLIGVGFRLSDLIQIGVSGSMFLARFFSPGMLVSKMNVGPIHGHDDRSSLTGPILLTAYSMRLESLFDANVGLLAGPPEKQRDKYVPIQVGHLRQMEFTLTDLELCGMDFDFLVRIKGSFLEWDSMFSAGEDWKGWGWIKKLPYDTERYKNRRGTALVELVGWQKSEIKIVGLHHEMEPFPVEKPSTPPPEGETGPTGPPRVYIPQTEKPVAREVPTTSQLLRNL